MHIPLDELQNRLSEIPQNKNLIVFCKSGVRSKKAIDLLSKEDFKADMFSLQNGLSKK